MLTETQKGSWQKRLMIFEHLCKENNIEVTDFMEDDFVRIMGELQEYDIKIHSNSTNDWGKTKKMVFDITNIFLASEGYKTLRDKYKYLKISTKEFNNENIINLSLDDGLFLKEVVPYEFINPSVVPHYLVSNKLIVSLLYELIEYSITTKVDSPETKSIIVNIYDFIRYLVNMNSNKEMK